MTRTEPARLRGAMLAVALLVGWSTGGAAYGAGASPGVVGRSERARERDLVVQPESVAGVSSTAQAEAVTAPALSHSDHAPSSLPTDRSDEPSTTPGGVLRVAPGDGPEPLEITARSVVSASFALANTGPTTLPVSWELGFPVAWSPIGPVAGGLEVPARGDRRIHVLFSVPADAAPGTGLLTLVVRDSSTGNEWARATKPYRVAVTGRLVFSPSEDDRVAFGGVPYRIRRWLTNTSNVTARVDLEASSSNGWDVELLTAHFDLPPGMGEWVEALVKPPRVWEAEVAHSLTVMARTKDLTESHGQATLGVTTRVLSGEGGRLLGLRGRLELEGILPVNRRGGAGVNLALAGDIGPQQHLRLQLGDLLSTGREAGLTRRGTFVDLTDDRWGGVLIGSTTRAFTPLTAPAQRATWGEIRLRSKLGTWSLFSSLSQPGSLIGRMAGLSLNTEVGRGNTVGFVAFQGEHAPNSPKRQYTMATVWAGGRLATLQWQGEIAAARLKGSDSLEPAWRFAANGTGGRWSWGAATERASTAFPGTIWNYSQLWGRIGYRPQPSLRFWVGGQRVRSPDLESDNAFDSLTGEAGVTWSGLPHGSLSLSHGRTSFGATASRPVPAEERTWNLRIEQNLPGNFTAASDIQLRERDEDGRRDSGLKASYALRHRPGEDWYLQARFEPAPTHEQPFDFKQRWSLLLRWQPTERTWFEFDGEALRCGRLSDTRCKPEPALRLSLGRNLKGPMAGWHLIGYGQRQGSGRDLRAGVMLARDVALRSPFGRRGAKLVGELRMADGRPGPDGVRIRLGERTIVTDARGKFRFGSVPLGDHLLDVRDLGLSLMVDRPLPISVRIGAAEAIPIELRLVEPGRVAGVASIERGRNPQSWSRGSNRDPDALASVDGDLCDSSRSDAVSLSGVAPRSCWAPLEGVAVHLQHTEWPRLQESVVSDGDGRFQTNGLLPGRWRAWVASIDVPADRELSWEGRERYVDLRPGETVELDPLLIRWHRRPEDMVESPPLVIALPD